MDEEIVEFAREEAVNAIEQVRVESQDRLVEKVLKNRDIPSLEPVKRALQQTRKAKMRTCSYYLCDQCNKPILDPDQGFVFHGNVYNADPNSRGGIIGNNFPLVKPDENIKIDDVEENVFCQTCLVDILRLDKLTESNEQKKSFTKT